METKDEILSILQEYLQKYPHEKESLSPFIKFVNDHDEHRLFDRRNFVGHLTASAFIINAEENALLLLKHKALGRWLQPGGHIDLADASLMASALREAEEETGIPATDLVPMSDTVVDFDSHFIPENLRKQEPSHFHHDVRFLFKSVHTSPVHIAEDESDDSKWIPFHELENDVDFGRVVNKVSNMKHR